MLPRTKKLVLQGAVVSLVLVLLMASLVIMTPQTSALDTPVYSTDYTSLSDWTITPGSSSNPFTISGSNLVGKFERGGSSASLAVNLPGAYNVTLYWYFTGTFSGSDSVCASFGLYTGTTATHIWENPTTGYDCTRFYDYSYENKWYFGSDLDGGTLDQSANSTSPTQGSGHWLTLSFTRYQVGGIWYEKNTLHDANGALLLSFTKNLGSTTSTITHLIYNTVSAGIPTPKIYMYVDWLKVYTTANPMSTLDATFTASPTSGYIPLTVAFTPSNTTYTSYAWDFGDGQTSTATSPNHTYTTEGEWVVTLNVSDGTHFAEYSTSVWSMVVDFGTAPIVSAFVGDAYSYTPTVKGGTPTWSLTTNAAWLTLSNGVLSGTPPVDGSYSVSLHAQVGTHSLYQNFTLYVYIWDQLPLANNVAGAGIYPTGGMGSAIYADGKLFFTYEGTSYDGNSAKFDNYVGAYDMVNHVLISSTRLSSDGWTDGHQGAKLIIDADGYIHAWYGAHNSALTYARSNAPYSFASFTVRSTNFAGNAVTYPSPFIDPATGTIYVLFRDDAAGDDAMWSIKSSTDKGLTWSSNYHFITASPRVYLDSVTPFVQGGTFYVAISGTCDYPSYSYNRGSSYLFILNPSSHEVYLHDMTDTGKTVVTRSDLDASDGVSNFNVYPFYGTSSNMWGAYAFRSPNGTYQLIASYYDSVSNHWKIVRSYYADGEWKQDFRGGYAQPTSNAYFDGRAYDDGDLDVYYTNQTVAGATGVGGDVNIIHYDAQTNSWSFKGNILTRDQAMTSGGSDAGLYTVARSYYADSVEAAPFIIFCSHKEVFGYNLDTSQFLSYGQITSTPTTTATEMVSYSYQVTARGTISACTVSGASFLTASASGLISGTPGLDSAGSYNIAVNVTTDQGYGEQYYTLVVSGTTIYYTITSSPVTTGEVGVAYSYQVTANGTVSSWSVSGLSSLSISSSGMISGTPVTADEGTHAITVTGTTAYGDVVQHYDLVISPATIIYTITSTPVTSGTQGLAYTYSPICDGTVTVWTLTGNATWLSIDAGTGRISGTPMTAGSYTVTIVANTSPSCNQTYTLTIDPLDWDVTITVYASASNLKVTTSYTLSDPSLAWAVKNVTWSFGDLTDNATGATAIHTFDKAGSYTLTCTVTNVLGANTTATKMISVKAAAASTSNTGPSTSIISGGGGGGSSGGSSDSGSSKIILILPILFILLVVALAVSGGRKATKKSRRRGR